MSDTNQNIKNFIYFGNNNKNENKENFEKIPRSWKKFGEVFCNQLEQPIFACFICLENADSINTAYTTNDGSVLWWHIQQQHISIECETLDQISAEVENFETDSFKSDVSYNLSDKKLKTDERSQNLVNLLEEFHQNLVNEKAAEETNFIVNPEPTHSTMEDNPTAITDEQSKIKETKPNRVENIMLTISDDEDDPGSYEDRLCIKNESNITDYLIHNDIIEISDEESSEDHIETRPNTPAYLEQQQKIIESFTDLAEDKRTESNNVEESSPFHIKPITGIPTPDPSSSETAANSNVFPTTNYCCNNDESSKNSNHPFTSFQSDMCDSGTIKDTQAHLESSMKTFSFGLETNPYNQMLNHQVKQSYGSYQQNLVRQAESLRCKICFCRFKSVEAMKRHYQRYHGPNSHLLTKLCEVCNRRILTAKLQKHMEKHFAPGLNCIYCGLVYKRKDMLNVHIYNNHPERMFNSAPIYPPHFSRNTNVPTMPYDTRYTTARFTAEIQQQVIHQPQQYYLGN